MSKIFTKKASILTAVLAAGILVYYLLLCENFLHTSIGEIIDYAETLDISNHLIILGLLPVYIAVMVFGAVMFGIYLGKALQCFFLGLQKE